MRVSWFLVVFSVIGAVLLLTGASAVEALNHNDIDSTSEIASSSRKLKEMIGGGKTDMGNPELEDYGPVDPSPISKVIKPGPIEHGTPLMPYLPNPAPPPQLGG